MKRTTKKLAFTKESVRVLRPDELRAANGGTLVKTIYTCPILNETSFCVPQTFTAYQTGCDSGDWTLAYC